LKKLDEKIPPRRAFFMVGPRGGLIRPTRRPDQPPPHPLLQGRSLDPSKPEASVVLQRAQDGRASRGSAWSFGGNLTIGRFRLNFRMLEYSDIRRQTVDQSGIQIFGRRISGFRIFVDFLIFYQIPKKKLTPRGIAKGGGKAFRASCPT